MARPRQASIAEKFALFDEHRSPKVSAEPGGQHARLVELLGPPAWRGHGDEDGVFPVFEGAFRRGFRDGAGRVGEGGILPCGVERRPVAGEGGRVPRIEPARTAGTVNREDELTAEELSAV